MRQPLHYFVSLCRVVFGELLFRRIQAFCELVVVFNAYRGHVEGVVLYIKMLEGVLQGHKGLGVKFLFLFNRAYFVIGNEFFEKEAVLDE